MHLCRRRLWSTLEKGCSGAAALTHMTSKRSINPIGHTQSVACLPGLVTQLQRSQPREGRIWPLCHWALPGTLCSFLFYIVGWSCSPRIYIFIHIHSLPLIERVEVILSCAAEVCKCACSKAKRLINTCSCFAPVLSFFLPCLSELLFSASSVCFAPQPKKCFSAA